MSLCIVINIILFISVCARACVCVYVCTSLCCFYYSCCAVLCTYFRQCACMCGTVYVEILYTCKTYCVCVDVCVFVGECVCVCVCVRVCVRACVRPCGHVCVHACVYLCVPLYMLRTTCISWGRRREGLGGGLSGCSYLCAFVRARSCEYVCDSVPVCWLSLVKYLLSL